MKKFTSQEFEIECSSKILYIRPKCDLFHDELIEQNELRILFKFILLHKNHFLTF